jgi:hypothetical protein
MKHTASLLLGLVAGFTIATLTGGKNERTEPSAVLLNTGTQVEYALPTPAEVTTPKPTSFSL